MKNVNILRAYPTDRSAPEIPKDEASVRVLVWDPATKKWYSATFVWVEEDSVSFWHIEGPNFHPTFWCYLPRDPR